MSDDSRYDTSFSLRFNRLRRYKFFLFMMIYGLVFIFEVIVHSTANLDDFFIVDYFKYKQAPYVAGFSCNDEEANNDLVKDFSEAGIFSMVNNLSTNATIEKYFYASERKLGIFLDLRCNTAEKNENLLTSASYLRLYDELHYWLILGSNFNESVQVLNDREYSLSTDLVITVIEGEKFTMYDVYNICKYRGGILNITLLGYWNVIDGFNITQTQSKFSRRSNFHNMTLRMAGILFDIPPGTPPFPYLYDYDAKQNDTMQKFSYAIWQAVAYLFNFTLEYIQVEPKKGPNRNAPIIKMLGDRDAEIGGNTAIYTPERVDSISPSPVWPLKSCFIFRTTHSKRIKFHHFLRPLADATWYLIVVFTFLLIFVFASVLVVENRDKYERYSDAVLFTIGSLCQQGSDIQVTKAPTRIALLQAMIFSLLLYNYYSASVVSARLNEPLEKINDSLNELAKTNLKFGAERLLYFNFYIKRQDWEGQQFYNRKWVKIPENEKFLTAAEGMKKVRKGGYAFHADTNVAFPMIERSFENEHVCQLTFVHLVPPTETCLMTARNNSFTEMAKVGVARVRETGLRARLIHKWAARTPRCRTDILVIDPLTIYEVAPAFLLLAFGAIAAIAFLGSEKLFYCKQNHDYGIRRKLNSFHFKVYTLRRRMSEMMK